MKENKKMKIAGRVFVLFLGLAVMIPGALSSIGQTSPPAAPQNPHHDVSVTLKLVQIYVTDKKGNPAPGLTAADFEITDDGKPVSITDFEYHAAVFPGATDNAPAQATAPAPAKLNRKFFLWFDFGFNDPSGIKRAKAAGLHFMDTQIRPEDQVALLSSSSLKGISVHEYLTGDHSRVRQAVNALDVRQIAGRLSEIELLTSREQEWARFIDPSGLPSDMGNTKGGGDIEAVKEIIGKEGAIAQDVYRQMSLQFLKDFRALAKAFRYIPGAKSLILFSGGIAQSLLFGTKMGPTFDPYGTIEDQARFNQSVISRYGDRDCQNEFQELVKELRASNTFIYPINEIQRRGAEHDPASRDLQGDGFLRNLASETKGQYFHNTQDSSKAVEDIQKLTASYYVLGYRVSENWDGRYHTVKVAVNRKNLQCWGTSGYFNPVPFSQYTVGEKRLHLIDLALSDAPLIQGIMDMPIKAIPVRGENGLKLAVLGRLPRDPGGPLFGPKTEAFVLLLDERKGVKEIKRADLVLTPRDGDRIILSGIFPILPGRYTCRLIVRDLDSGQCARATVDVNAPAPAFAGLNAAPPLWLTADTGASWKDLFSKDALTSFYPFERTAYLPLLGDIGTETAKVYAVLPVSFFGVARPELTLAARLVETATGKGRSLPLVVLKKTEDEHSETYFLELTTGPLPPGAYSLYLFVQDKTGFKKAFISTYQTR
jgi:VWFA-related protein